MPVVFFSTDVDGCTDLTLGRHRGHIDKLHENLGHMGRTNYHCAMDAVIDHYLESGSDAPALVVFQTDGGPTSRQAAERHLCKAARLPLFWQFIGFGDPEDNEFSFLRRLDTLAVPERRVVDNAGFFHAGRTPRTSPTTASTICSSRSSPTGCPRPVPRASCADPAGASPGSGIGRAPDRAARGRVIRPSSAEAPADAPPRGPPPGASRRPPPARTPVRRPGAAPGARTRTAPRTRPPRVPRGRRLPSGRPAHVPPPRNPPQSSRKRTSPLRTIGRMSSACS